MGSLVDFALKNRFIVLVFAVLLFVWGIISFRALPVEAYPDVRSRAAGDRAGRDPDERHPASGASSLDFARRPFERHADL
jgi:hypothetical protein